MKKHETLASEIIAEQREKIEEQIKFYEELRQRLLTEVDKIEAKSNSLKEYLEIDKPDRGIDYSRLITDLMGKFHNKGLLERVYRLLIYLYLNKDDEEIKGGDCDGLSD